MSFKFKDRNPKDTIELIKKFFNDRNCTIVQSSISEETESGTWWNSYQLYYGKELIGRSNGKGTSKEFAEASGLAELYERFCNRNHFSSYYINKRIKNRKYDKFGYYEDPREKEITYEEAINNSPKINFLFNMLDDKKGNLKLIWENLLDKFIAVPFSGFNMKDEKYLVPEFVLIATGSDGMAAGNTLNEALVQGASEICEHYIWDTLNNLEGPFPCIDLNSIKLPIYLKNIINKLDKLNYKIYCIDFSRIYNLPVLGLYTVDTKNHVGYLDLGAHPIFEIALERTLTETYQGHLTLRGGRKTTMLPYKMYGNFEAQFSNMTSITNRNIYNENILLNQVIETSINNQVFLPFDFSNDNNTFIQYFKNLFNKLDWHVYYRDVSLCKDFFAIHLYSDNVLSLGTTIMKEVGKISDNKKTLIYKNILHNITIVNHFFENNYIDLSTYNYFLLQEKTLVKKMASMFLNQDFLFIYFNHKVSIYQIDMAFENFNNFINFIKLIENSYEINYFIKEFFNKYKFLIIYGLFDNHSSIEEIKKLSQIYNLNYSNEDYNNMKNKNYYLKKLEELILYEIKSEHYKEFFNIFLKE